MVEKLTGSLRQPRSVALGRGQARPAHLGAHSTDEERKQTGLARERENPSFVVR
jgi:hypothetical protein